jgi:tetratricopeptide (TPR) repeat protein
MMENNTRDRELILGHIEGTLSAKEQVEVEYRLKEEPDLQKLVAEYESIVLGIRQAHLQEKLQQIKALEASLPPVDGKQISMRIWLPLAAAAALVIAAALWFLVPTQSTNSYQALYTAYFEPFDSPGSGLTRSSENEQDLKARAYLAYDSKDYEEASRLFIDLLKTKDDPIADLCLGSALLAQDKPEEAEKIFMHFLENHEDLLTQAKWYLALTFLRQGKIERTKATLWEVSTSSTYGEEARELLKKLD